MDPAEVAVDEAIALHANDIGHLEEGPSHFFLSLRQRRTPLRLDTSNKRSEGYVTDREYYP